MVPAGSGGRGCLAAERHRLLFLRQGQPCHDPVGAGAWGAAGWGGVLRGDVRRGPLGRGPGAPGLHLRKGHPRFEAHGGMCPGAALRADLCGAVHRADHPGPQEGPAALLPHRREVCRPAGLQTQAHPAVPEDTAPGDSPVCRYCQE